MAKPFQPGKDDRRGDVGTRISASNKARVALKSLLLELRTHGPDSNKSVAELAMETIIAALQSRDDEGQPTAQAIKAAEVVLAYAYGKPKEQVSHDGTIRVVREDGGPTWRDRHSKIARGPTEGD